MTRRVLAAAGACVLSIHAGCAVRAHDNAQAGPVSAHGREVVTGAHWRPSDSPTGAWAVLLPGASGLSIFDDARHYFRAADALNACGIDAIVLDYRDAYRATPGRPDGPAGVKIAWVVEEVVSAARRQGLVEPESSGVIMAWSLGAEGVWELVEPGPERASSPSRAISLGMVAAIAYYPANERVRPIRSDLPLLVLAGGADDVTPAREIRAAIDRGTPERVECHVFAGAHHGFDVDSIDPPRTVRVVPLIGPRATFGFDSDAANGATRRVREFLAEHGLGRE